MRQYRPDIDGLRAVAILPVLAFHAGLGRLAPGGFVGVDVFFVISGYLITLILRDDIERERYSITEFYSRRVRRIFPALLCVFIFVAVGTIFLDFPFDLRRTSDSITSSAFFFSNIRFYLRSGYFTADMERNPLLHTWSLSVEEQFYIFYPLLLYAILRFVRRWAFLVLLAITCADFLAAAYMVTADMSAAFYLVQYRAWELLTGALVALSRPDRVRSRRALEALGAFGLLAVVLSTQFLSPDTAFPGPAALPACLGTAAIIYSGARHKTLVALVLSARPIRYLGRISYSLYLWHWPVIVFVRHYRPPEVAAENLVIIAAFIIVAAASERFVERPFRAGPPGDARRVVAVGLTSMAVISGLVLALASSIGLFWTVPDEAHRILAYANQDSTSWMRPGKCYLTRHQNTIDSFNKQECLKLVGNKPNYLILGDSHAAHLWAGLDKVHPEINFLQATASGCKPLLGTAGDRYCTALMHFTIDTFVPSERLDGVMIAARWNAADVPHAIETARRLSAHAKRVVIVGPIVEYDLPLPRLLAANIATGSKGDLAVQQHRRLKPSATDAAFEAAHVPTGVIYASAYKALCEDGGQTCTTLTADGAPVQFDYGHLTEQGSALLASRFSPALFGDQESGLPH